MMMRSLSERRRGQQLPELGVEGAAVRDEGAGERDVSHEPTDRGQASGRASTIKDPSTSKNT